MKEKIYTIPVTDAFSEGGECPFCTLEKKLESEAVSYVLGASMMEPDSRIISNEMGYCRRHYEQMDKEAKALSLALVLDTHLDTLIEKLQRVVKQPEEKKGLFKRRSESDFLASTLTKAQESCLVCDKLSKTLDKMSDVFWYLYKTEADFKHKVENSQGFCIPHFTMLLSHADHELSGQALQEARAALVNLEIQNLRRLHEEVCWFAKKFDYRYQNEPWKNAKDAPRRVMEKLTKFL